MGTGNHLRLGRDVLELLRGKNIFMLLRTVKIILSRMAHRPCFLLSVAYVLLKIRNIALSEVCLKMHKITKNRLKRDVSARHSSGSGPFSVQSHTHVSSLFLSVPTSARPSHYSLLCNLWLRCRQERQRGPRAFHATFPDDMRVIRQSCGQTFCTGTGVHAILPSSPPCTIEV